MLRPITFLLLWPRAGALLLAWTLAAAPSVSPLPAQEQHRIWASVSLTDGDTHEGFLRWDRNEGSWIDILDAWKEIPEDVYEVWRDAWHAGEGPTRTVELKGYRITWDEEDPEFPRRTPLGVRFGHVASIRPLDAVRAEMTLRSGRSLILESRSSDLGWTMRDLTLRDRSGDVVELEWADVSGIEFGSAPPGMPAEGQRLYGLVRDRSGQEVRGFLAWDLDEILTTDVLDGYDDGRDREIQFSRIASIERHLGGANVTLKDGETLYLRGTNDVGRGHRGVQVSVPDVGGLEVEWDELDRVVFEEAPSGPHYDDFDGGVPLQGRIRLQDGEEISGLIRWNGDVEESWELLEGSWGAWAYRVEFGRIKSIRRGELDGAQVVLQSGQELELDGRSDVNWDNRGIFVKPASAADSASSIESSWRLITWDDFDQVWFGPPTPDEQAVRPGS